MRIAIEGNIASGKSTQVKLLEGVLEPHQEWPLNLFYGNPERWSLLMQLSVLKSFINVPENSIVERSPESSLKVFWKIAPKTDDEDKLFKFYNRHLGWVPDLIVYIRTPPNVCFERIRTRKQTGDIQITKEYLETIHKAYEEYVSESNVPVIIVDGTLPVGDMNSIIIDAGSRF
jgi:thymidylate kinase